MRPFALKKLKYKNQGNLREDSKIGIKIFKKLWYRDEKTLEECRKMGYNFNFYVFGY